MPRHADPNARDSLIAAARREFARCGIKGARIEDITAACGLSKGAFYLHFPSKEALFGELAEAFFNKLGGATEKRQTDMMRFFDEHGPITRRDIEERSPRHLQLLEMEAREDLNLLEMLWAYRDVLFVLLRGAQGTPFEGAIWEVTDREVARIQENIARFQGNQACRSDIPSEIFGSLIVGTYMLLALRMSRMTEKPDLAAWARSLHTIIREGSSPVETEAPQSTQNAVRSAS